MNEKIILSKSDRQYLSLILQKYRQDFEFIAFGSRVTGKNQIYSDLDLAVKNPLQKSLAALKNDLEDSRLSITVDIVDLEVVSSEFRELILATGLPVF